LSLVAGVTERVRLGTSIMIMPLRSPVVLAKELATLQFLSGERLVLGAGVGWYGPEYTAIGIDKSERGRRTDEILDIMLSLWAGERVSYDGRYYQVRDAFIEPRSHRPPALWIGGGSQLADEQSPELPRFAEGVKARVARGQGWIARPTAPPEAIASDWAELGDYLRAHGRQPDDIVPAHENFVHLVLTDDRDRALAEQRAAFATVMSPDRGSDYLEKVYLFGTPDEIVGKLQQRIDAGIRYFMLHTMTPDPAQLEDWIEHLIEPLSFPQP
jgi:alkanesulfonate monooxygenase SsuD/methylene tetrahydromethanopterin reductase-like flavin-dependent oxidoreductase (luciferase family)